MSRIDHGQVELKLGDETVTLKPTLKAILAVNKTFGDFKSVIKRVEALDFEAIAKIVNIGADSKNLDALVFETGLMNVYPSVVEYLAALMNPSGREVNEDDQDPKGQD